MKSEKVRLRVVLWTGVIATYGILPAACYWHAGENWYQLYTVSTLAMWASKLHDRTDELREGGKC